MGTEWETEQEELGGESWDQMPVSDRVVRAKEAGLEGKLGSKSWEDLSPGERTTIMHPEERPAILEYKIKAHVALEDSDIHTWGVTKDIEGSYTWKPGEGQIVGTWSRSPSDGLIHVFLEEPISALVDKATQSFARLAETRKTETPRTKTTRTRAPKTAKPPAEPSEEEVTISNIRKLLGK